MVSSIVIISFYSGSQLSEVIKFPNPGNSEGLCVLVNALISAIANPGNNGVAEVFCGDAEFYEVIVQVATNLGRSLATTRSKIMKLSNLIATLDSQIPIAAI
ncbi:hypothetical protein [Nostoc sp.]|uniref:hypothetical protein n=1 Tax=Nostoc sp. TaxID=1180 RepID=UPI002FF935A3